LIARKNLDALGKFRKDSQCHFSMPATDLATQPQTRSKYAGSSQPPGHE
jgi:hypothetical protein